MDQIADLNPISLDIAQTLNNLLSPTTTILPGCCYEYVHRVPQREGVIGAIGNISRMTMIAPNCNPPTYPYRTWTPRTAR